MKRRDRALGMGREISRRDFFDGAGVAVTGSLLFPRAQVRTRMKVRALGQSRG